MKIFSYLNVGITNCRGQQQINSKNPENSTMEIMGLNGDINTFYMKAFDFSYLLSTIGVK